MTDEEDADTEAVRSAEDEEDTAAEAVRIYGR